LLPCKIPLLMKATRRNFIQTLGVGAIGLTVPKTSHGDHCIQICF